MTVTPDLVMTCGLALVPVLITLGLVGATLGDVVRDLMNTRHHREEDHTP